MSNELVDKILSLEVQMFDGTYADLEELISKEEVKEAIGRELAEVKPSVPKYVAIWYEEAGKFDSWWNYIYRWGRGEYQGDVGNRIYDWFVDYNEENFVDMFRYGYTVQKEDRFFVLNKPTNQIILYRNNGKIHPTVIDFEIDLDRESDNYALTKEEIMDYNPLYWKFSVPAK